MAFANPFLPDDRPVRSDLPLWQRDELLDSLAQKTEPTISKLARWIGTPASLAYDKWLGRPLWSGSTGGDVLDSIGMRPSEGALGGWGRPLAEFGFEAVFDPTNLIGFGGTIGKAAKAAKAVNILDDAARAAGRGLVDDIGKGVKSLDNLGDLGYAKSASRVFTDTTEGFGKRLEDLTDDDLLSRPLVGSRAARRNMTLDELVQAQADPAAAQEAINQYLQANYRFGRTTYDAIKNDKLYSDVGLWLPGVGEWGAQIPDALGGKILGEGTAKLFDRAGQALRWGGLGRRAVALSNVFGDHVAGQADEMGQVLAKSDWRGRKLADARASAWVAPMMRELAERSPQVFTDQNASTAVRNVIEGTATAGEQSLVKQNGGLDDFVTKWRTKSDELLDRSKHAGISSAELDDPYDIDYFPRGYDPEIFARGRYDDVAGGRQYSVNTPDQIARSEAYQIPGGTQRINELSRDQNVLRAPTDAHAAEYIRQAVNQSRSAGQPEYSLESAVKLARDIRSISPKAQQAGRGMFDSHFTEDAARYVQGRERAIERSRVMLDALAGSSRRENYLQVPRLAPGASATTPLGDAYDPINQTLANLGLKTVDDPALGAVGAKQQLLTRINSRLPSGVQPLTIDDLANVSLNQRVVDRFTRIADYYAVPRAQGEIVQFLDDLTSLWKSSVLSWPSRFARDWFSGSVSNLIEVGNPLTLVRGYAASKRLMEGKFDDLGQLVLQMPKYKRLPPKEAIAAYRDDLAIAGLLSGRRIDDYGMQLTGRQTGESLLTSTLPGAKPVTTLGNQLADVVTGQWSKVRPIADAAYGEINPFDIASWKSAINIPRALYTGNATTPLQASVKSGFDVLRNTTREAASSVSELFGGGRFTPKTSDPEYGLRAWLADRELKDPILRWSSKLGDTTDQINRLSGYNALLLQGVQPQEAARRMASAQIDYGDLTTFERNFIRRVVPFWTYNSRIGAYVAQKIFDRPAGAYTQLALKLPTKLSEVGQDEDDPYTPKSIKETVGMSLEPLRQIPGIGWILDRVAPPTDGVNTYLNSIEVPGAGLINMLNVKQGLDGSIQPFNSAYNTTLDVTGNLMHPLIRYGVEGLSGRNLHTGKTLHEFIPTVQKLGQDAGVDPGSYGDYALRGVDTLTDFIPHAPRFLQLMRRLTDDERVPSFGARFAQSANNMLTGTKITPISDDAARMDASRELSDMLSDSPLIRQFEQRYIPEELLPYASPDDLLIYRLDRQMRKEARAARKRSDPSGSNPFGL